MCLGKITPLIRKQIWGADDSKRPVIVLPWMLAHGVDTLIVMDEMRAVDGSLSQQVFTRFAEVRTDRPDSWSARGTSRTTNGRGVQAIDISATTDQLWVQVALKASAGADATAEALSAIQASSDLEGRIIAARNLNIQPVVNSGEGMYIPLAKPHVAAGLTSYMFAVILTGVDGTVTFQPAWRKFTAGLDNPEAWIDLDTSQSATTDTDYNSGTKAVTPGTVLYAQPGLKVTSTGGRATVRVLVSAV